ncbi:MAG: hypothetical protein ISS82_02835 [Nanoarchaeota archaeon]|nr:hypothetical protein [Nanoarchaeota archaeon]
MKTYTNFWVSFITSALLLSGCAGPKQKYKVIDESSLGELALSLYNYENQTLPTKLKEEFIIRIAQGYQEFFNEFLERVDLADGIDDNFITMDGLAKFLSNEIYDELDKKTRR